MRCVQALNTMEWRDEGAEFPQNAAEVKIKRNLNNAPKFLKNSRHFRAVHLKILRVAQITKGYS